MKITSPNVAWGTDITYIKIKGGYVYLAGIIDIFSRKIMGWSLSTFMDTSMCLDAYNKALKCGKPDVINSDQGCQYTSNAWTKTLLEDAIQVSMDGKGRWADNIYIERFWRSIKYELVFLHSFETVEEIRGAIAEYIEFYNAERPHQSLGYKTPDSVYYQHKNKELKNVKQILDIPAEILNQNSPAIFLKGENLWS